MLVERCGSYFVVRIELAIGKPVVVSELYQGFLTVRSLKNDLMRPNHSFEIRAIKTFPIKFYRDIFRIMCLKSCNLVQQ